MFHKKEEEQYLAIANSRIAEAEKKVDILTRQIESLENIGVLSESLELLATAREALNTLEILRFQFLIRLKTVVAR